MNSPACLYLIFGSGPNTPCLERAGHYSGELPLVNHLIQYFSQRSKFSAQGPSEDWLTLFV